MKLKSKYIKLTPAKRIYQFDKPIIALTGGIASGKSTVTKILQQKGLSVIDADQLVKAIYQEQAAKDLIKNNFPTAWVHNEIDFKKLRELVFSDNKVKEKIESFIYARLPAAFKAATLKLKDQDFFLYDVPLLFERGLAHQVDFTVVVYASRKVQLARLIDRDDSKTETGNSILDQQMDIEEKKEKADFVIDNSNSLTELAAEVDRFFLQILE